MPDIGDNQEELYAMSVEKPIKATFIAGFGDDCLKIDEKENQAKKKYKIYTLSVEYNQEKKHVIVFREALNRLQAQYGKNSVTWVGQLVEIKRKKKGEYYNFDLYPSPKTESEVIEQV